MHRKSKRFRESFEELPEPVKKLAEKNFKLLQSDPRYPSLHFKKIGDLWSARVGLDYRALAIEDEDDYIWVWIGSHDDYEKIIKKKG